MTVLWPLWLMLPLPDATCPPLGSANTVGTQNSIDKDAQAPTEIWEPASPQRPPVASGLGPGFIRAARCRLASSALRMAERIAAFGREVVAFFFMFMSLQV